jgi:hypothetical protein
MAEVRQEPGRLDIYCQQGHRVRLRFTAPGNFPDAFTAAGTIIRSTWRAGNAEGAALLTLTTVAGGDGFHIVSATVFDLIVSAETMAGLGTPGQRTGGTHDIEIVPGGVAANAYAIAKGRVVIDGENTR